MSFKWTELINNLELKEINNLSEQQKVDRFLDLRKELPNKFNELVISGRLPAAATGLFRRSVNWRDLVNMPDDNGTTLLMRAASLDCQYLVRFLVSNGADVNYQDLSKATALHAACEQGAGNAAEELLTNANPNINLRDRKGQTAEDVVNHLSPKMTFLHKANVIPMRDDQGLFANSAASFDQINSKDYIAKVFSQFKASLDQAKVILGVTAQKKAV